MRVEIKGHVLNPYKMVQAVLLVLLGWGALAGDTESLARELDQKCYKALTAGDYQRALNFAKRALALREELSRQQPVGLGPSHMNLALAYLATGRLSAAMGEAEKALRLASPEDRSGTRYLMAKIHFADRKYELAEQELREVLAQPAGADRGTLLNDLGMAVAAQGRLGEARRLMEEARSFAEESGGVRRSEYGLRLANLALVCYRQGDLASAAPLYRRAIEVIEATLGAESAYLGMALAEYSQVLRKTGPKSEAKLAERRAKAILAAAPPEQTGRWTVDIRSLR